MYRAKKLVSVLATFTPVTEVNKEDDMILEKVSCIYYPVWFKKNEVRALIDFGSKVNAISLGYASKLGLKVCRTNVEAQKINDSTFKTFEMILASFQIENKLKRAWFF